MARIGRRRFLASTATMLTARWARAATDENRVLRAGTASVDITPPLGVTLDGTIMRIGPAREIHDSLYARALVLDDGTNQLAIAICDVTMLSRELADRVKQIVEAQCGLAAQHVLVAGTHTHMAPRMVGIGKTEVDLEYYETFVQRTSEAICRAVEQLTPAAIGWASVDVPDFCENRRWIMRDDSVGPNPFGEVGERVVMGGQPAEQRLRPAGPTDPQLSVLSVRRLDGRPLALLGNYSIHYSCYAAGVISADYFGGFCRRAEEILDEGLDEGDRAVALMTNGTSGDINRPTGGLENIDNIGQRLADVAVGLSRDAEHHRFAPLAASQAELAMAIRRPDEERLAWAHAVLAGTWNQPAHPWKKIYAENALQLAQSPASRKVLLQAFRLGSLGIVAVPCEVFAQTGLKIKQTSPLQPTFTIQLANGYSGYLPPPEQFELGGYETWPAVSSCLEKQAEPKIRSELLTLLNRVRDAAS